MATAEKNLSVRDTSYDWLRLFATLCVVLGHSCYLEMSSDLGGVSYAFPEAVSAAAASLPYRAVDYLSHFVYAFHMPLFFMLSGAVLALKPLPSLGTLLKTKARRLLLPYLLYGFFFMFPLKLASGYYTPETVLPAMGAFLLGGESGHLWFLPTLFWAMAAFVGLQKLLSRLPKWELWLPLLCALLSLGAAFVPGDLLLIVRGLQNLFYFAGGFYFEKLYKTRLETSTPKALVLLLLSAAVFLGIRILDLNDALGDALLGSLTLYFLSYLCSRWFAKLPSTGLWKLLIPNLFYIYLLHDPLEYVVLRLFLGTGSLTGTPMFLCYLLVRILGIFLLSLALGQAITWLKRKRKTA